MKRFAVFFTLAALALLALLTGNPLYAQTGTSVFVNEIHYDNSGTDTGEAIEIAGPAGTDLTGWSIVLYNGSNGTVYDTDTLSGALPDQGNGFGMIAVNYPSNGIQNGSPDGIALVDDGGTVVQFLSYEGTLVAANGPASGQVSTDIGVSEGSGTPEGAALQLTGTGMVYEDFTWSVQSSNTFGAPNVGQTFGDGGGGEPPVATPLVINEIDYDQPGTDGAEFLEIKNNSAAAINLDAYSVVLVNGNGGVPYATFDLPNVDLAAGDYFVLCANAANTPECDLDVGPDTNLIQNGSPDAAAILLDGAIVDTVSYEGSVTGYTEGSGATGDSTGTDHVGLSRLPDGADTNNNNTDFSLRCITPGAGNTTDTANCQSPGGGGVQIGQCLDGNATLISAIQGDGLTSPLNGQIVVIEGIVTGDFQDMMGANGDLNGFYMQEEDSQSDGNALTSEGIFVFQGSNPAIDVQIGDVARVLGTVAEFAGSGVTSTVTELTGVTDLLVCDVAAAPAPTDVFLPVAMVSDLERYEGMFVRFPQQLVISEYFNFDRFNETVLTLPMTGETRLHQPTAIEEPASSAAAARANYNTRSRITLDDGRTGSNPDPAFHPNGGIFDLSNTFRGGDLVQNATGILDDSFDRYRIHPTQGAAYTAVNPRSQAPDSVGSSLTVASFNVLNYFTTLDYPSGDPLDNKCGPLENQGCRGADADQPLEFSRQRDKIIAALTAIDASVVGLIEIENHPEDVPTADLVSGLNAALGAGMYDFVATGAIGTDAIRVALIYKPAAVTPLGGYATLDTSIDSRFNDDKNRPVLAQTFQDKSTGGVFTVAVNHFKSKGSPCDDVGDPDAGDGAGNCNLTRKAAAEALVDWLATDPTNSSDPDFLVLGDLNSYDKEDPIDAVRNGSDDTPGSGDDYTDLVLSSLGRFAYSYVFDGQLGYLDHALSNQALLPEVTGTTVWHINADEPDILDYDTSFKQDAQDALYEPNAYRSSDHDPIIVGLNVCDEIAPTLEVIVSPTTLWPPNHKYVTVNAVVNTADNFDPNPIVNLLSVESNEPDNGLGDGDTPNDIVIIDDTTFELRAERAGGGTGRIYTVTYQVTDACGNSAVASAAVSVPHDKGATGGKVDFTLTILHNNDGESQLISASGQPDFGGVARFTTLAKMLHAEGEQGKDEQDKSEKDKGEKGKGKTGVIVLSSGDNFLAGPELNASLATFENDNPNDDVFYDTIALREIGYDAMALGNHEFDLGPDVLVKFIDGVEGAFPFVSANLDFSGEPALQAQYDAGWIVKSTVVKEKGERIGIVGATTPNLPFISSPRNVQVDPDVAGAIQAQIDALAAAGINKIIIISHLQSIDEDLALAPFLTGVDVMIAGGGDELLANPADLLVPGDGPPVGAYPLYATGGDGANIPVVTTAGDYKYLGRLVVEFDKEGNLLTVDPGSGPVRVAGGANPDAVAADPLVQAQVVDPVQQYVDNLAATVIGTSEVALDGTRPNIRTVETNEGNLMVDSLLWQATQLAGAFGQPMPDIALQNGGGIRNSNVIPAGPITLLDTFSIAPFSNFVVIVPAIQRAQVKEILENAVSRVEFVDGRFAHVGGFSMVYDLAGTAQVLDGDGNVVTAGTRVREVMLDNGTPIVASGSVVAGPTLNIATIDFLANGGDQYPYRGAPFTRLGVSYQQALSNYIQDGVGGLISAADYPEGGEGRITQTGVAASSVPREERSDATQSIFLPLVSNR